MNRKKTVKTKRKESKAAALKASLPSVHPYDDVEQWFGADFSKAPETEEWQREFQRRIDIAFGAEGAFTLAWSGDRRYWDEFYTDWFYNGLPKEESLEKKPILLWHTFWVNDLDYIYLYPPRWVILENHHPAQYAESWESAAWVGDAKMVGGKKRIRPKNPPAKYHVWFKTIAQHDEVLQKNEKPLCCRASAANGVICYGKYRKPNDTDLEELAKMRRWMDENKIQRADAPVDARSLQNASRMTRYYVEQTQKMRMTALREFAIANPTAVLGASLEERGMSLSANELESLVTQAMDQIEDEKHKEAYG